MNMFNNNKILVVIPIINNSFGISGKHVRLLNNKPLISYSIELAKASQYVDDVVVSTVDSEIALISEKYGASVIRRSVKESDEIESIESIVYEAMIQKEKLAFDEYDIVVILQPNSPLVKSSTLDGAIEKFEDFGIDTVLSVIEDTHLSWGYDENHQRFFPNYIERSNKQDLPKSFKETEAIIASRRGFIREDACIGDNINLVELSREESINIENNDGWIIAESYLQKKKIAIIVNANKEIGTRHIDNCLAIASKLVSHDFAFFLDENYDLSVKMVKESGYPYVIYDGSGELFAKLDEFNPQIVVNDILDTSSEYMSRLKENGYFTVNFDDLGVGVEYADVVFDSLYEHDLSESNVFSGHEYYVLMDEFYFQPLKVITQEVKNVLIIFEGNDYNHLSERFLNAILSTGFENRIDIIVGSGFEDVEGFVSKYESNPLVQIYQNVHNISEFMFKADIIITSATKTMYESCSLGVPTICVCQDELEKTHVFANTANGFVNMGLSEELSEQEIAAQFLDLVNNPEIRISMNQKMLSIDLKHGFESIKAVVERKYRDYEMKKPHEVL